MGTPARFMRPRIIFFVCAGLLVAFGLVMIYSASSIMALSSSATGNDPAFYLKRQLVYALIGLVLCIALAVSDYHLWSQRFLRIIWVLTLLLLGVIFLPHVGQDAYGASRWISIGGFSLQPSEFAKITLLLSAANLLQDFSTGVLDLRGFIWGGVVGLGLPLILVLLQPDKGTVVVIAATVLAMALLAGVDRRACAVIAVLGVLAMVGLSLKDDYSRARIVTMINPWTDPYGDGYQLIQGFYAFGTGGLLGVGLGFSRQKYSYLPMAHNDFIFAIIGEELGLAGTLGMLCAFAVLLWAGFRIARYAPDLAGRLIACGASMMLVIQMLLNVAGVLGIFPLSGKPIPFISYGGSSIISSLMLVGLAGSVSMHSKLPETPYERRRHDLSVTSAARGGETGSGARSGLTVHSGGLEASGRAAGPARSSGGLGSTAGHGRLVTGAGGRSRIDLGPDPAERLRTRGSESRTRAERGSARGRNRW